jgi:hypothetical protein
MNNSEISYQFLIYKINDNSHELVYFTTTVIQSQFNRDKIKF